MNPGQQKGTAHSLITNYYYLAAGLLAILFAFTHAWNGQTAVLPKIYSSGTDMATKTTMFYVWHILTAENAVFGISFIVMAFCRDLSKVRFAAWMIAAILIVRWGVISGSTLMNDAGGIVSVLTDLVVILVYVGIILLGARKKG
jgi:hypothetical protein